MLRVKILASAVPLVFAGMVAGGELLTPYDSAVGQVVLVLPLGMWLGCVLWLRALCRYEPTPRYRIKGSSSVPGTAEQAGAHR